MCEGVRGGERKYLDVWAGWGDVGWNLDHGRGAHGTLSRRHGISGGGGVGCGGCVRGSRRFGYRSVAVDWVADLGARSITIGLISCHALARSIAVRSAVTLLTEVSIVNAITADACSWTARSIAVGDSRLALAGLGAAIPIFDVSIITLLEQITIPHTITAACWRGTTRNNIRQAHSSITERLRSITNDILRNSKRGETVDTNAWIRDKGLVDGA